MHGVVMVVMQHSGVYLNHGILIGGPDGPRRYGC